MKFKSAFEKTAANASATAKSALDTAKRVASGAKQMGNSAAEGLKKSMNVPLGKHLNLSGVSHVTDAAKQHGGFGKALKSGKGRAALGEGLGKAAPSLAAGAGYAYAGKKLYDKTLGSSDKKNQAEYLNNYYNG